MGASAGAQTNAQLNGVVNGFGTGSHTYFGGGVSNANPQQMITQANSGTSAL